MVNRVMQRDNIGVMALLEMVDTVPELGNVKPHIVVANAHIHWDPEFCDVKLIQTVMLMSEIKSFMEEVKPSFSLGGIHLLNCIYTLQLSFKDSDFQ